MSVRDTEYGIIKIRNCSSLGPRYFGKFRFYLRPIRGGEVVSVYGKTVAGNSRTYPVSPAEIQREGIAV